MYRIKIIIIIFLICIILVSFKLELNAIHGLEKGTSKNKYIRINSSQFTQNPFREITRYIEDSLYYGNIWRVALFCASVITIIMLLLTSTNVWIIFPLVWLVLFCIIYQVWLFKYHHYYEFIYKSIGDTMKHLDRVPKLSKYTSVLMRKNKKLFKQTIHP